MLYSDVYMWEEAGMVFCILFTSFAPDKQLCNRKQYCYESHRTQPL